MLRICDKMEEENEYDRPGSVQMTVEVPSDGLSSMGHFLPDGVGFSSDDQPTDGNGIVRAQQQRPLGSALRPSLKTVEFSFLDNKNICCGLCGEIVPYDLLMSDHLPNSHPEVLADANTTMEEISYETWLQEKLQVEKRSIESGFKMTAYRLAARAPKPSTDHQHRRRSNPNGGPVRQVSSIRVNPREMTIIQLDQALRKKMFEKLGRQVPVSLIDKLHARCGLCNAIISLNKKFEIVHLVRHFNCWHPTAHVCAGSWQKLQALGGSKPSVKPLTLHDFAIIDTGSGGPDSLQCIWCGMFIETLALAQHFAEVHPDDIEVPKCNLCMQELILNARFQEKFAVDFDITLPDEHHMRCGACGLDFTSELSLDRHVIRRHIEGISAENDAANNDLAGTSGLMAGNSGVDGDVDDSDEIGPEAFANSRMTLGKRRRPKRQFIMPALRQAVPLDSVYVEPIAECHWKCKVCEGDIYGAVISAAAIKHYKYSHPEQADNMQYELCKARLEKVSDGCMEFVHPQLIECLLCQQSFNLHQPFNMCRGIRHLKSKHPNLMPEYAGLTVLDDFTSYQQDSFSQHMDASPQQQRGQMFYALDGVGGNQQRVIFQQDTPNQRLTISTSAKLARLDHTAAALPPTLTLNVVDNSSNVVNASMMSEDVDDNRPVYILVADEAQQQQVVQQVMAVQMRNV